MLVDTETDSGSATLRLRLRVAAPLNLLSHRIPACREGLHRLVAVRRVALMWERTRPPAIELNCPRPRRILRRMRRLENPADGNAIAGGDVVVVLVPLAGRAAGAGGLQGEAGHRDSLVCYFASVGSRLAAAQRITFVNEGADAADGLAVREQRGMALIRDFDDIHAVAALAHGLNRRRR